MAIPKSLTRASRAELNRRRERRRASGSLSPNPYNLTISHAHRFVWFRNAKVATRTILAFLEEQHPEELLVLSEVPYPTAAFTDYFKFGFVRHPLDRFISAWQDKVCDRNHFHFAAEERERMRTIENFAAWVAEQDLRDLPTTDRHLVLQSRLVDLTQVDFVGRMETFGADFSEVCERVGLELERAGAAQPLRAERRHPRHRLAGAALDRRGGLPPRLPGVRLLTTRSTRGRAGWHSGRSNPARRRRPWPTRT